MQQISHGLADVGVILNDEYLLRGDGHV